MTNQTNIFFILVKFRSVFSCQIFRIDRLQDHAPDAGMVGFQNRLDNTTLTNLIRAKYGVSFCACLQQFYTEKILDQQWNNGKSIHLTYHNQSVPVYIVIILAIFHIKNNKFQSITSILQILHTFSINFPIENITDRELADVVFLQDFCIYILVVEALVAIKLKLNIV